MNNEYSNILTDALGIDRNVDRIVEEGLTVKFNNEDYYKMVLMITTSVVLAALAYFSIKKILG